MKPVAVICAGSHAVVLIEAIRLCGTGEVVCAIDDDKTKWGTALLGVLVSGPLAEMATLRQQYGFNAVVIGMANYQRRQEQRMIYNQLVTQGLSVMTVVHPSAFISPTAVLGRGVYVGPGAVIHTRAQVGDNVVVNTGSTIDHDAVLGSHAFISPGVTLAGHVDVGSGAYLGPGAIVGSRIRIGAEAVVGGGACVLADVGPGAKVYGIPAKPKS